jgi:hypothetical protein
MSCSAVTEGPRHNIGPRHRDQAVHGLYTNPKTGMFFSDAKAGPAEIIAAVKTLVPS